MRLLLQRGVTPVDGWAAQILKSDWKWDYGRRSCYAMLCYAMLCYALPGWQLGGQVALGGACYLRTADGDISEIESSNGT